ncbi:MAG: hypothetical protein M3461_15070 [Pseudomonadota bacterium]|nr:hypothetical protein [Pseudomonadota bacterium]
MGNRHVYWLATVLMVLGLGPSLYLVAQLRAHTASRHFERICSGFIGGSS